MLIQVRPIAGDVVTGRLGVNASIVSDVKLAARDDGGVLVGVRLVVIARAFERRVGKAAEAEVPVRCDRVPTRSAVLGFVHLLEAEVDVVAVCRVDGQELVVPSLDARGVALADAADLLGRAAGLQFFGRRDLGPRAGGAAARRLIHTLKEGFAVGSNIQELRALNDRVKPVAGRRVGERRAALGLCRNPSLRVGDEGESGASVIRDVQAVGGRPAAPACRRENAVSAGARDHRHIGDHVGDVQVEVAAARRSARLQYRGPVSARAGVEAVQAMRGGCQDRRAVLHEAEDQGSIELVAADPCPGAAAVAGGEHADSRVAVRAGIGFAGAGVYGVSGYAGRYEQSTDRERSLCVGHRVPVRATIERFPHSSVGRAEKERPPWRRGQSGDAARDPAVARARVAESTGRINVLRRVGEIDSVDRARPLGPGTTYRGQSEDLGVYGCERIRVDGKVRCHALVLEPSLRRIQSVALLARILVGCGGCGQALVDDDGRDEDCRDRGVQSKSAHVATPLVKRLL